MRPDYVMIPVELISANKYVTIAADVMLVSGLFSCDAIQEDTIHYSAICAEANSWRVS